MRTKIFLLGILSLLLVMAGCLGDKKKEEVPQKPVLGDTAPEFAITLSNIDFITTVGGVDIVVNISAGDNTTAGTIYYVVNTTFPAIAPTAAEIRTGRDARWRQYYMSGNKSTVGNVAETISITGLTLNQEYDIFLASSDVDGYIIRTVTKVHITADTTPPTVTTLSAVSSTETILNVVVTQGAIEAGGKLYYVLTTTPGVVAPTAGGIKLGLNGSSTTAGVIKSAIITTRTTATAIQLIGLTRYTDYMLYVVTEDINRNLQTTPSVLALKTKDTTAPKFSTSSAMTVTATNNSAVLSAKLEEAGTIYYVIVPDGTAITGTTSGMIKAGKYYNGTAEASTTSGAITTSGIAVENITLSGILFSKQYEIFVVAEDVSGNVQTSPVKLHIGTDFTPPPMADTTMSAVSFTEITAVMAVTLNEKGKVYYVALPNASATPTAVQIKAGKDSTNTDVTTKGSVSLTTSGAVNFTISGLKRYTDYEVYYVGEDAVTPTPNTQITVSAIHIKTVDTTPPVTTPVSVTVTTGSAVLSILSEENGKVYYTVMDNGTALPTSAAAVKAHTGATIYGQAVTTAGTLAVVTISGITFDRQYELFVVAEDAFSNLQKTVTKVHLNTDQTPPTVATTSMSAVVNVETSAVVTATIGEKGRLYYVVLPNSAATPTAVQIKDGQNASGSTVTTKGAIAILSSTPQSFTVSGLARFTDYEFYAVAEDSVGNLQTTVSALHIKTVDKTAPKFTTTQPAVTVTTTAAVLRAAIMEDGIIYYSIYDNLSLGITTTEAIAGTGTGFITKGAITTSAEAINVVTLAGITMDREYELYIVAKDTSNNIQALPLRIHLLTDKTPPSSLTLNTVTASTPETAVKVSVLTGEKGKVYIAVTTAGAVTPSAANIKAGTVSATKAAISLTTTSSAVEYEIKGLTKYTDYKLYAVAEDEKANLQTTVTALSVKTVDITLPTNATGYPQKISVTTNSAVVRVSISEAATVYYEAVAKGDARTPADIITASSGIYGNTTVAALTTKDITVSGLTQNLEYDIVMAAVDVAGNTTSAISRLSINTAAVDATLQSPVKIKTVTVSSIGTPANSIAAVVAGEVSLTGALATSTTALTVINKNNADATIRVVKYAKGASTANFATDTVYNNEMLINGDFFLIKVTAQNTAVVNYYKILVNVSFGTTAYAGKTSTGTGDPSSSTTYTGISITEPTTQTFNADAYFRVVGSNSYTGANKLAYVKIVKDADPSLTTMYWLEGNFDKKIWLRYGAGAYTVTVHYATITSANHISAPGAYDGDILGWSYYPAKYTFRVTNTRNEDGRFLYASEYIQSDDSTIINAAITALAASPSAVSVEAKSRVLHDYVVNRLSYDMSSLDAGKRKKQDAVTAFNLSTGVCEGYTSLYNALLRSQGIQAKAIAGDAGGAHAWSNVFDGSLWKFVDTTWDDPIGGSLRYTYFWLDGNTGVSGDHTWQTDRPDRAIGVNDVSQYLFGKAVEGMY